MQANRRLPLLFILGGLLLLLLWAGIKGWRVASSARSLLDHQAQAELLLAEGLAGANPDELEALTRGVRQDIVALKREVSPFMPLAARMGWVPGLGASLAAAPHLLEMADAGTEGMVYALQGLKPVLAIVAGDNQPEDPLPELLQVLNGAEDDMARLAPALNRVAAARDQIEREEQLPGQVQDLLHEFDDRRELILAMPYIARVLPDFMGIDGERTYLIIAQNEDELRPTGGFISGAGLMEVSGGNITEITFQDANFIDAWWEKPYDWPPDPLIELMGLELYLFRDTNFWPDFPTSAEQAIAMYQYSQDYGHIDGVLAIDQQFLAMLLGVTGPVEITELDLQINQTNAISQLRSAWSPSEGEEAIDWIGSRKDFLGPLAAAMRARIETNLATIDPLLLGDTMMIALEGKHFMVYMRDPQVAAVLDRLNWDGRLETTSGQDFLMTVDSNVGYNKINPLISASLDYRVELDNQGSGLADLRLTYQHGGEPSEEPCAQGVDEVYYSAGTYDELISGCYMNYLRVYAPLGSELLAATQHFAPPSAFYNESGWDRPAFTAPEHPLVTTFANFFMLPEGETLETSFQYQLPAVTTTTGETQVYQLQVFRQPGTPERPITVAITLPEGADLISTRPAEADITGRTVTFSSTLDRNRSFVVTYGE
jgi:hypothetical protein